MGVLQERHGWDEEIEEFYFNDTHIITTTHDEMGWSGMESIRCALRELARAAGIEYQVVYIDEEEEETDDD